MKKFFAKTKNYVCLFTNYYLLQSDKDVRKTAYDMLFAIACSFKESQSANSESPLHELLTMVIYFHFYCYATSIKSPPTVDTR